MRSRIARSRTFSTFCVRCSRRVMRNPALLQINAGFPSSLMNLRNLRGQTTKHPQVLTDRNKFPICTSWGKLGVLREKSLPERSVTGRLVDTVAKNSNRGGGAFRGRLGRPRRTAVLPENNRGSRTLAPIRDEPQSHHHPPRRRPNDGNESSSLGSAGAWVSIGALTIIPQWGTIQP